MRVQVRDARLVFPVIAGNNYFIQVESGQRFTSSTAGEALLENRVENIARETEIRQTIGSYRLVVRQMPQAFTDIENGVTITDDYPDAVEQGGGALTAGSQAIATPIPFSVSGPTNGTASLTGVIQNTPFKPADNDIFTFTTPGSGTLAIRLNRAIGSTLNADALPHGFLHPSWPAVLPRRRHLRWQRRRLRPDPVWHSLRRRPRQPRQVDRCHRCHPSGLPGSG